MSKSIGNVIAPDALIDAYGADAVRYFLLREVPFGGDGEFSHEGFLLRYNSDLANDLGNLGHRALTMNEKWLGGQVPTLGAVTEGDAELHAVAVRATEGFRAQMESMQFKAALEALWELVRAGNKYVDKEEPWALNKRGDVERLATVLGNVAEVVRIAASYLWCVCPNKATEMLNRLGLDAPNLAVSFNALVPQTPIASRDPLFPRLLEIPESLVSTEIPPVSPAPVAPVPPVALITYDDFAKVQLRTGLVIAAEKHPKADRLLVLKVNVGEAEPRTIVAGIAAVYAPEDLVGQTVIVVVNLAPAKLRGIESQGMLLAAGGADIASILTPLRPVAPGSIVK